MSNNGNGNLLQREPTVIAEAFKATVTNVIAFLVILNTIPWNAEQVAMFMGLINSVIGLILAILVVRPSVTPNVNVKTRKNLEGD